MNVGLILNSCTCNLDWFIIYKLVCRKRKFIRFQLIELMASCWKIGIYRASLFIMYNGLYFRLTINFFELLVTTFSILDRLHYFVHSLSFFYLSKFIVFSIPIY